MRYYLVESDANFVISQGLRLDMTVILAGTVINTRQSRVFCLLFFTIQFVLAFALLNTTLAFQSFFTTAASMVLFLLVNSIFNGL